MAEINYASRDFDTIKNDILTRASVIIPEWTNRDDSDFAVALVDMWAYFADVLHYYIDRAAAEAFISTATQREALLAIANLFDYLPHFQTASTATVTVVGDNVPAGETIVIPSGTVFVAPAANGLPIVYFTSTHSASVQLDNDASIGVEEGEPITDETIGVSSGLSSQRFSLFYSNVIASSVDVYVYEGPVANGSPTAVRYQRVDKLYDATSTDKVFTLLLNATNEVEILFGNAFNGKIPNAGQTIVVNYRRGAGLNGNVSVNRITQIIDSPSPYITNIYSTVATGGSDVESISSLKNNVPSSFSTQNRAVSLNDYKNLLLNVPGIAKGTAAYASGTVTLHVVPFTSDYLTYSSGTIPVSTELRTNITDYYAPRQMIGTTVTVASSVTLTAVNITATIFVLPGYIAKRVQTAVETALDAFFEFDNVYFDQTLSKGEIYRAMMAIDGVDYVTISTPSTETVVSQALRIFKKGTYTLTTSGGITGT